MQLLPYLRQYVCQLFNTHNLEIKQLLQWGSYLTQNSPNLVVSDFRRGIAEIFAVLEFYAPQMELIDCPDSSATTNQSTMR
jgi:hypothetical protein